MCRVHRTSMAPQRHAILASVTARLHTYSRQTCDREKCLRRVVVVEPSELLYDVNALLVACCLLCVLLMLQVRNGMNSVRLCVLTAVLNQAGHTFCVWYSRKYSRIHVPCMPTEENTCSSHLQPHGKISRTNGRKLEQQQPKESQSPKA